MCMMFMKLINLALLQNNHILKKVGLASTMAGAVRFKGASFTTEIKKIMN